nr:uncharacterized protein LOC109183092 [Ipomoea trifida]
MSTSSQCPQGVSAGTPQSVYASCDIPPTRSSCHSVDAYPVTTIKGTAYPTTAETTIVHNQPVLPNHVKVMVDEVVIGADDCLLPVPVLQYKTLNDVVGAHTQWHIHLVLLDEGERGEGRGLTEHGRTSSPPLAPESSIIQNYCLYHARGIEEEEDDSGVGELPKPNLDRGSTMETIRPPPSSLPPLHPNSPVLQSLVLGSHTPSS